MRKLWAFGVGVFVMVALFVVAFPAMVLWPRRRWRQEVGRVYSRLWARACLWAAGVRLEVTGREHLVRPAVLTFNHTNMLDFFVNASFAPPGCLVFGKRELARVPFLGWVWFLSGHPMIARRERDKWQVLLDWVEGELRSGLHSTIIAPEGTRSGDGRLAPFKKGPFHLAARSGAPIVPCVLHGVADRRRGGRIVPGPVRVQILAPIPSTGWDPDALDEPIAAVRALYLEALGQSDAASPQAAASDSRPA